MKTRTEKEHYIPNKSYLDYFTDPSLTPNALWVYFDKRALYTDPKSIIPKLITPINLCKESYLYETPHLPVNAIEKMLKSIEDNYKHVLDTKIIPKKPLNTRDRQVVAYFISTLHARTPLNKANSDQFLDNVKEHVVHLEEQFAPGTKSQLHQEIDDAQRQNSAFTQTLLVATQMNMFQVADFLFLTPQLDDENEFFITSDFPVSLVDFTLMNGFYPPTTLDATVEITIPLTSKITLLVNHLGLNGHREIDPNFVREINNRTIRRSRKFIISPKKFDEKFIEYTINRFAQSFVLLFLSEGIRKRRMRKTNTYMKKTIKQVIKSIIKNHLKQNTSISSIDYVQVYSQDNEMYQWFVRALTLLGDVYGENDKEISFKLRKNIATKMGNLDLIKVSKPDSNLKGQGAVYFHN